MNDEDQEFNRALAQIVASHRPSFEAIIKCCAAMILTTAEYNRISTKDLKALFQDLLNAYEEYKDDGWREALQEKMEKDSNE